MDISKDNKGTSLIELVIALMIAAIILLMIMVFLNNASKSFRRTNDDVKLQMEAQTIINQLSNLAMEAIELEAYSDITSEKRFIFKYETDEYYTIIFNDSLLYQVFTTDSTQAKVIAYSKEEHLLAEHVISLDVINTSNKKSVIIELSLSLGNDSAKSSKKVKFRNVR